MQDAMNMGPSRIGWVHKKSWEKQNATRNDNYACKSTMQCRNEKQANKQSNKQTNNQPKASKETMPSRIGIGKKESKRQTRSKTAYCEMMIWLMMIKRKHVCQKWLNPYAPVIGNQLLHILKADKQFKDGKNGNDGHGWEVGKNKIIKKLINQPVFGREKEICRVHVESDEFLHVSQPGQSCGDSTGLVYIN